MLEAVKHKHLQRRHPGYQADYWRRLRAFYEGGQALLGDDSLMGEVFPQHAHEHGLVYAERKRRAVYLNYAGFLVNQLRAHLFGDPLRVSREPAQREAAFYDRFLADCSAPGGERMPWQTLLKEQVTRAMVEQTAWTLVDLPAPAEAFGSRAEQEAAGALDAYAVPVHAASVVNWHDAGDGALALVCHQEQDRGALDYDDKVKRHVYDYYTVEDWARFVVEESPDRRQPGPDDMIHAVAGGTHAFGQVPLVRLRLPASQWVMDPNPGGLDSPRWGGAGRDADVGPMGASGPMRSCCDPRMRSVASSRSGSGVSGCDQRNLAPSRDASPSPT